MNTIVYLSDTLISVIILSAQCFGNIVGIRNAIILRFSVLFETWNMRCAMARAHLHTRLTFQRRKFSERKYCPHFIVPKLSFFLWDIKNASYKWLKIQLKLFVTWPVSLLTLHFYFFSFNCSTPLVKQDYQEWLNN